MRNTELAKRLRVSETIVRRMLDPKHNTKSERIQSALAALGKRIVVRFEDAAQGDAAPLPTPFSANPTYRAPSLCSAVT
jgi:hypothetical protein